MERKTFEDVPGGNTIIYDVADQSNGYLQPTFMMPVEDHEKLFNSIPKFPCRDDDAFIVSYPKSGVHWLWEMLVMAMMDTSEVTGRFKSETMIESAPAERFESFPSPRLLNHHLLPRYQPTAIAEKGLKLVLLLRNPKDVAVSFYNHTKGLSPYKYDGKFENFLQMFMRGDVDYGSYVTYLKEWQQFIKDNKNCQVSIVYYEDLKTDCLAELKKLTKFLEITVDENRLAEICAGCSIDKLKQAKLDKTPKEVMEMMKTILKGGWTVYRKGQVGDWKNWFTVAQNEAFDEWWKQQAADIDMFNFKYTT